MATTTIYVADNRRGSINAGVGFTDWDELLGETEGDDLTTGSITQNSFAARAAAIVGRGSTQYRLSRFFAWFDVSSLTSSNAITNAVLKISGRAVVNNGSLGIYEGSAFGGDGSEGLETTQLGEVSGTSYSSNEYGSPGYTSWVTGNTSQNSFTLNSAAISDMNTNGYLNIVGRNIYYDAEEQETPDADNYIGINQWTAAGTNNTYRPQLFITYLPIATAWGQKMNGVLANAGNKYNSVLSTTISKINDVAG